jgi:hypothetical protein
MALCRAQVRRDAGSKSGGAAMQSLRAAGTDRLSSMTTLVQLGWPRPSLEMEAR